MSALDDVLNSIGSNGGGKNQWGPPTGASSAPFWEGVDTTVKKKKRGFLGGNLLQDVFDVASTPLHAITSTGVTLGRTVGALGGQDYGEHGPSLKNWWEMIASPEDTVDFGDVVSGNPEKGLTVGVFKGENAPGGSLINWNAPTPVRIAAGLAGDVALDPLTYVMPAGEIHGAAEAAGHIADSAGLQIGKEMGLEGGRLTPELTKQILTSTKPIDEIVKVSPEAALKIEEIRTAAQDAVYAARRGGASALTADQLDRFGTYTNELGKTRTLEKGLKLDFGRLGNIKLTQGEGVLGQASVIRHKMMMQLGDRLLGAPGKITALGKLTGDPELRALARAGEAGRSAEAPLSMMDATVIRRLRASTRVIADNAAKEAQRTTLKAIKGFTDEEINLAHEIIDTGGAAAADASPRVQQLAQNLSDAFEKHAQQLVKAGVLDESQLMKAGTYFPSPITQDARDAMIAAGLHPAGEGAQGVRGFVEGQRRLWDPTTGEGGIGRDTETTRRIGFKAKTRLEAEQTASKELAKALQERAAIDGPEGDLARQFIGEHPEAVAMLEKGEYPLFQQGREALVSQTRAIGRRVAQARAGRRLFEQGYGVINPRNVAGFVDYGPTAEEVAQMLRLGEQASETAIDRAAAAREMELTAKEMEDARAAGLSAPEDGVAVSTVDHPYPGSDAAGEARLAASAQEYDAQRAAEAAGAPAAPEAAVAPQETPDVVGQVLADKQAKIEQINSNLPPEREGYVRVYNHRPTWGEGMDSEWFTDNLGYVAGRGAVEDMRYIDMPRGVWEQLKTAAEHSQAVGEEGVNLGAINDTMAQRAIGAAKPVLEAAPEGDLNSVIESLTKQLEARNAPTPEAAPAEGRAAINEASRRAAEAGQLHTSGTPIVGGPAAKAHEAVITSALDQQMREGFNQVERTMDDIRAYLKNRTVFKGPRVAGKIDPEAVTGHFDQLTQFLRDLQLAEPSSFGYADPLSELSPFGFKPTGEAGGRTAFSLDARARQMEKLLKEQVRDFERNPTAYAAKTRARIEGQLAEDAAKARVGATLPDKTLVPERRVPWTYEEKQAHKAAEDTVKSLGAERGKAIQDVKRAEAAVREIRRAGAVPLEQHTMNIENEVLKLEQERDALRASLEAKKGMDLEDAAAQAEQRAYERPVGSATEMDSENLANWAERNTYPPPEGELTGQAQQDYEAQLRAWEERQNMPIPQDEVSQYKQGMREQFSHTRTPYPMSDKVVNDLVERRIAALEERIQRLQDVANMRFTGETPAGTKGPATNLDVAERHLADAKARLEDINAKIETAKAGQRPPGSTPYLRPATDRMVEEITPGSPYEQAVNDFHAKIAEKNAKPVEPHLEGREQWAGRDRPKTDRETGKLVREGTLQESVQGIDPEVVQKRADKIREDWKRFGRTEADHRQMAQAWEDYHGQIDKYVKPSVERDMVAQTQHQVDAVGRMAQADAHVTSAVDDLVADAQAVAGSDPSVIPEQVQVNVQQRAVEAQQLGDISKKARATNQFARAEIANMRIIANRLANDAEMYASHAEDWLNEWHSITQERKLHSAVNSLLVQGQIDWLAHTALQRGILTPRAVADAVTFTERLATPEGQSRLAESWRKALHWMRVWQITSPGFHVRNLFGGIFNNALAGVDAGTYFRFARLWKRATTEGVELTPEEAAMWAHITGAISPGQISSEALGNPASRIMGEAAVSKTPWGQLGTHGALPRISESAGANVEFYLRGSLMYDTLDKGGSLESAIEAVNKYHFDYNDMSHTEQWLKANAVPFLTWTRHNVPLQLQMMVENPRVYARFAHFKREVESQSTVDPVVPGYFADINAVRLPWQSGGGHNYYIPDMPFRDVGLVTEPIQQLVGGQGDLGDRALAAFGEPIGMTTPLISGPVEWMLGKQFFKGIPIRNDRGIALKDLHIPDWLAKPLSMTPVVKKANGRYYITEHDFYILEKTLPILGRARRLGGSAEKKQQDKLTSRLISFFLGTQIRTNNEEDQKVANYLKTLETKRKTTITRGLGG